jgi:hypothetical protein
MSGWTRPRRATDEERRPLLAVTQSVALGCLGHSRADQLGEPSGLEQRADAVSPRDRFRPRGVVAPRRRTLALPRQRSSQLGLAFMSGRASRRSARQSPDWSAPGFEDT